MKQHYQTLDSFRGICACLVALSHFNANSIFRDSAIFDRGSIYVDFFFVLSGFVIFANYAERLRNGFSLAEFTFLRFGRVYPLHFFVLMAFIMLDVLQMFVHVGGAALYEPFSAPGEGLKDIVANLLLVHSLGISEHHAFNGPSWSISTEFYTYILFGLLLCYVPKYQNFLIAATGLCAAIIVYKMHGELYAKLDYGFFRCVYGFACGALVWEIFSRLRAGAGFNELSSRAKDLLEILLIAGCITYIQFFSGGALSMLAPLVFAIMIYVFAFEGGIVSRFLKNKFFLLLGTLSYSIYMIHIFISGKFFELPVRLLESKMGWSLTVTQDDLKYYGLSQMSGTLWEIFYLAVVIACSFISYKIIEEPFRKWSKQWAGRHFEKQEAQAGV